jgi:creatinine amidohydrolase
MLWHEQTWPGIAAIDKETVVLVPLASLEQHGHHLPLFVDSIQVTAIAERAERELKNEVLLLPTLWLGSSHHHMDFPGTVSVPPSLYSEMIKSVARCILAHGFRRIFFLNGHGGNEVPAAQALSELVTTDEKANDAFLTFASWWGLGKKSLEPQSLGMATPGITHACEYETSFILALRPDLVKLDEAVDQKPAIDQPSFRAGNIKVFRRFNRMTSTGNAGTPSAATKEKGDAMFDALVRDVVNFVREFSKWPHLPVLGPK